MTSIKYLMPKPRRRSRLAAPAGCLLATVLSAAALSAAPERFARAAPPIGAIPSVRVSYRDLDLSSERGAQALLLRIESAARQVCPSADTRDLSIVSASHGCVREAVARAVRRVRSPTLAALYSTRERHG